MGIWQAVTIFFLSVACLHAAEAPKSFAWDPPVVMRSMFTPDLGMLDSEREEYATNLASLAANQVVAAKASAQSLAEARRLLALALHLSPRNKRAIVVNFQLAKGILPEVSEGNYSPQVFARLLLSRGQLLEKQGGDENKRLARMFVHLAAGMDPKNEDAVYASEVHRLDYGTVDWSAITDGLTKKP
jgi:hypothetical protein